MTNNELLFAISNMLDPLKADVRELREDVRGLKEDVRGLKEDVRGLEEDVRGLKEDVQELKVRVKKMEVIQENELLPRLNTIEACYTSTYERYKGSVDDYETMKQDLFVVKKVVAEHSEKLQRIG